MRIAISASNNSNYDTVGDALDRLEIGIGRIGMNTGEQAFAWLVGMDDAAQRIQALPPGPSRASLETQFNSLHTRLKTEANLFVKDLGGAAALRARRAQVNPPAKNAWWFLDAYLADRRARQVRRVLVGLGIAAVLFVLLIVIYKRFLAPDPAVVARYASLDAAQTRMVEGNLPAAMQEVQQGLASSPGDPSLLVLQGVLLEQQGSQAEAEASFNAARAGFSEPAGFYIERGQAYILINQIDAAQADAEQAVLANTDAAQAYLLLGQIYEIRQMPREALDAYDRGFVAADAQNQPQIAALARARAAYLMQSMSEGAPQETPSIVP